MNALRSWAGLDKIEMEKIAEIKGFGFKDALKCRWMRNSENWSQNEWESQSRKCLDTIIQNRKVGGYDSFNQNQMMILEEKRYNKRILSVFSKYSSKNKNWNPLFYDPSEYSITALKIWLDEGGNVNMMSQGKTMLNIAIEKTNEEAVSLLIAAGANINGYDQ